MHCDGNLPLILMEFFLINDIFLSVPLWFYGDGVYDTTFSDSNEKNEVFLLFLTRQYIIVQNRVALPKALAKDECFYWNFLSQTFPVSLTYFV